MMDTVAEAPPEEVISFEIDGLEEIKGQEMIDFDNEVVPDHIKSEMYDAYVAGESKNPKQVDTADDTQKQNAPDKKKKKTSHFAYVDDNHADHIASKGVKDQTHVETKWAVNIFWGKKS